MVVILCVRRSWATVGLRYSVLSLRMVGMGSEAGRLDLCAALLGRSDLEQRATWVVAVFPVRGSSHWGLRWP